MKKPFRVKDLAGKILAKCKTSKGQLNFANNCEISTVCFTLISDK